MNEARSNVLGVMCFAFCLNGIACVQSPPKAEVAPAPAASPGAALTASSPGESGPAASPSTDETAARPEAGGRPQGVPDATPASIPEFGVPECDKYVKKYLACVEGHVTDTQKEELTAAFEANLLKWRALSVMKEGKLALSLACKAAAAAAKENLTVEYGCEF